jgi:hypothetical protein
MEKEEDLKQKKLNKELSDKAEQLSIREKCTVKPLLFVDSQTGENVIGFLKEPNRLLKLRMLDKSQHSAFSFAAEVLEVILLKEDSDKRFSSEKQEDDRFYFGAVTAAYEMVEMSVNNFKKK